MSKLLDPKILTTIKNLSLAAKTTIDGFMEGTNKNAFKGQGVEFSQYRNYQPGDDLRLLDWRMFARSDRYYVRESEVEKNITVRFLLDASNSMNHEDGDLKKIDYARYLAASLGYLASLQNDAVGLCVLKQGSTSLLAAKRDGQHLARFFHYLEEIKPEGRFADAVRYKNMVASARQKELLVMITDFHEQEGEIMTLLGDLASLKHEIIVFHIVGKNERELDYEGYTTLEDLETGARVAIGAGGVRNAYQLKLQQHIAQIRTRLLNKAIFHRVLYMDQPLNEALRDFLNQRNKIRG